MKSKSRPTQNHYRFSGYAKLILSLLALSLLALSPASAGVKTWLGTGGNAFWNTAANWSPAGVPAHGDDLVFPFGAANPMNTNDLVGRVFSSISFNGLLGSNVLFGNGITLTNDLNAAHTGGSNAIHFSISFATKHQTFTATAGGALGLMGDILLGGFNLTNNNSAGVTIRGSISGTGEVTKKGSGTLIYATGGFNSYSGTTRVNAGILALNANGFDGALGGPLVIGDGSGVSAATVQLLIDTEIPDNVPITINRAGLLDLNNFDETIGISLTINGDGIVNSGTATLTLSANATITASPGSFVSTINGKLNVNSGTCTVSVSSGTGGLDIEAQVSGSATINKTAAGRLYLNGANSFTGALNIGVGTVEICQNTALGSFVAGTTISNTAALRIGGCIDQAIANEALTIASTAAGGAITTFVSSTSTWTGPITLAAAATINVATDSAIEFIGSMNGTGGITKTGQGRLRLSGAADNQYSGATRVHEGLLELNKSSFYWAVGNGSLTIGDGVGGANADVVRYTSAGTDQVYLGVPVTVRSSGLLDLNDHGDGFSNLTLDSGHVTTGTGTLGLNADLTAYDSASSGNPSIAGNLSLPSQRIFNITNATLECPARVIGIGGITKTSSGWLSLTGSNSYTGLTVIREGLIGINSPWSLGTTASGTVVSNGATLSVSGGIGVTNESLASNGDGIPLYGNLDWESATPQFWVGPITVNGNSTMNAYGVSSELRINGLVSGPGGLIKYGAGTLQFEGSFAGSASNSYAGTTYAYAGVIKLNRFAFDGCIPGPLVVGDGSGPANSAVVQLLRASQINNASAVSVSSSGFLDLNGYVEGIDTLTGSGNVSVNGARLSAGRGGGSSAFDGVVSGAGDFYKDTGAGTITLNGPNTYTGGTHVNAGTLLINGFQPQSPVVVDSAGNFGGTGVVGLITVDGNLLPGASPGVLTSSNLTFSSTGDYFVELAGPNAGSGYDQMNVRGTNILANATLHLATTFTTPVSVGQTFTIINNDLSDAITGTFSGLPQGSSITANGYSFTISYTGGTGNDVVLTLTNVPAVQFSVAVTGGNGNHAVDPNECNHLDIVISNRTATALTGVAARLMTAQDSVLITQPNTVYPTVPTSSRATNTTPFQVSILPTFLCGSSINLSLVVTSASHGVFTVPVVLSSGSGSGSPSRYDVNTTTNLPDVGTIESTNVVAGFVGPLTKVTASLWLTHPIGADLNISLISPGGVVVDLSSGNGGGANFGNNCAPDAARTAFDDSAATAITAGSPPYVGTFRPEGSLANFIGGAANGNWRLRVTDSNGGTLGTLRCWSLFLHPVACSVGGGYCGTCPGVFAGSLDVNDTAMTNRLTRDGIASTCGTARACPGFFVAGTFPYDLYTFTNTGPDTCVSIGLDTACANLFAAAYLNSFDTNNLCANYLGDMGLSPPTLSSFSVNVAAGARFIVQVLHASASGTCGNYNLIVSGLPCPPPTLAIDKLPATQGVRVHWPTWAGGFKLEGTPLISPTSWTSVPNEPIAANGRFSVTNASPPTNRFYRLHKP